MSFKTVATGALDLAAFGKSLGDRNSGGSAGGEEPKKGWVEIGDALTGSPLPFAIVTNAALSDSPLL